MSTNGGVTVQEIKDKLDIVQVFKKYGHSLKKEGSEYKGSISATSKSGKSLHVNPDKQVYNDFAGHAGGGDVLDAIAYCEGLDIRSDFPQVLKIAADMAGIELHDSGIDYDIVAEKRELQRLYKIAFKYYHGCLPEKGLEYIRGKWGIPDKTIDEQLIGWAPDNSHLSQVPEIKDNFPEELLIKSGLFYCNGDGKLVDIYRGRIVFPYCKNGEIVYSIGRDPKWDEDRSRKKFIKQLVHSEKHPYVSRAVENVLFGLDSIKGKDMVYITEGIADAIVLLQAGLPVLSPVTVRFKESDIEQLVSSCRGKKLVKIINDNETSESGLKGAIDTAKALESAGIRAEIIILPLEG
ncbi:DNA primase [Methanomethylovorans hollandica DSM 15978]|uniref:DNA primase n=1 Tax=Methanomethylovorans hollandica (strain DSM 15978 / NBRC 107637 / DMS1) TaxID=867904 RepID=L0KXY0_METHD|nr:CHC2 zinc finger domain-containing protein [Methanomethylovorans hollandica]AGB48938.1 DNA primase [Methanomethylovorans hollandica DSM 15978]